MKTLNKLFIALNLLIYFTTMSMAQISEIPFNPMPKGFKPEIKWENDKLFVTYSTGIFYRDYSTGEVQEDWGQRRNQKWEMYGFAGHEINDFVINGDKILGTTSNPGPDGHLLIRSNDGGKTFEEFTPDIIADYIKQDSYFDVKPKFLIQNPNNKDELLLECISLYRSIDFGETWEKTSNFTQLFTIAEYHPIDSNILILGWHSWSEYYPNGNFSISYDGGETWESINYTESEFSSPKEIVYHPTNENLIVLGSYPIIKSEDKGVTWETIVEFELDEELDDIFSTNFEFDTRGSNRLYGIGQKKNDSYSYMIPKSICYSDDFGASWVELCEISLGEEDYVIDFVQHDNKIYTYSKNYKVHQIDLELLESSVEEVAIDNGTVSVSVVGNSLQINSKTPISMVEIYNISGVKLHSSEMLEGAVVDISALTKGTYVARLYASNGNSVSIKFNK